MSVSASVPELSFCIPCHNEEGNLGELIRQIEEAASKIQSVYRGSNYRKVCCDLLHFFVTYHCCFAAPDLGI